MSAPTKDAVMAALATVNDPDIRRPITELDMVESVTIADGGRVGVTVLLTIQGCPLKQHFLVEIDKAVAAVPGVTEVDVTLGYMSDDQRKALQAKVRGRGGSREVPFVRPESLTKIYAIASGKGGVGKSSVTVNLAAAMAASGLQVGVLDADIYGHSIPRMLGVEGRPTQVEQMIMPPISHGVHVISIGMLTRGNTPVVWRGPMLHRTVEQFLTDVFWGDLDVLLLDLPPGTGDVAISVAQLLPNAEIVVVTTPQQAAAEVAERAGSIAVQTKQRVAGVIENMSWLPCPHCDERIDVFGSGGGETVAEALSASLGTDVPLLGQVPLDVRLRECGDGGTPLVLADPQAPAAQTLRDIAETLAKRGRALAGRSLAVTPVGR